MKNKTFLLASFFLVSIKLVAQCNGSLALCAKKYNEVAYLTTHNAFNSAANHFQYPNQNNNLTTQLSDGVRGLMLDVYNLNGVVTEYHGFSYLGTKSFLSELNEIKTFLDNNPKEIVTIILECYTTANQIEQSINQAGLIDYLYSHIPNSEWDTLQTMIDSNRRLVILSDKKDASLTQPWYQYVWDNAVETDFENHSLADFKCNFNRGSLTNDLFILNHFITDATYKIGVESQAMIANSNPYFYNRVMQCFQEKGKFPNFITVDFYEKGDGISVVNQLNNTDTLNITSFNSEKEIAVFPNPATSFIQVTNFSSLTKYEIYTVLGVKIKNGLLEPNHTIDLRGLKKGVYFLKFENGANAKFIKE